MNILDPTVSDPYVKPMESVSIVLRQSALSRPVSGFQVFLWFDTNLLSYQSGSYTSSPYGLRLINPVRVNGNEMDMASGINAFTGQQPTQADATLVYLSFSARSVEGTTVVAFRPNGPPSQFTDNDGNAVVPTLLDSPLIVIDGTPPVITCPPNKFVGVIYGQTSATVDVGTATATDSLSGVSSISGARSDGLALTNPYPLGKTTITWMARDRSENSANCAQTVTVDSGVLHSVAKVKTMADETEIVLLGPVVTRTFGTFFYIEDEDRTAGIRVNRLSGSAPYEGAQLTVRGTMRQISGERAIDNAIIVEYHNSTVLACLGMTGKDAYTLLPQGLLVRLWGEAHVPEGAVDTFSLADGSPSEVRTQMYAVPLPADGSYCEVTGALGADEAGPILRVNKPNDLVQIVH